MSTRIIPDLHPKHWTTPCYQPQKTLPLTWSRVSHKVHATCSFALTSSFIKLLIIAKSYWLMSHTIRLKRSNLQYRSCPPIPTCAFICILTIHVQMEFRTITICFLMRIPNRYTLQYHLQVSHQWGTFFLIQYSVITEKKNDKIALWIKSLIFIDLLVDSSILDEYVHMANWLKE